MSDSARMLINAKNMVASCRKILFGTCTGKSFDSFEGLFRVAFGTVVLVSNRVQMG